MKITVIHGQSHKGVTYTMTKNVLDFLVGKEDEVYEFFYLKMDQNFVLGAICVFLNGKSFAQGQKKYNR